MKIIKRFYDEDLKNMLMEQLDVHPSQVSMNYTEEPVEGSDYQTRTLFYIDVEEEGE